MRDKHVIERNHSHTWSPLAWWP